MNSTQRPNLSSKEAVSSVNSTQGRSEEMIELAKRLWPYIKADVEMVVDTAIEEAKRGYR